MIDDVREERIIKNETYRRTTSGEKLNDRQIMEKKQIDHLFPFKSHTLRCLVFWATVNIFFKKKKKKKS